MMIHDMMNGKTINFKVLMKSSPGYEINVMVSLLSFNDLSDSPEIHKQKRWCNIMQIHFALYNPKQINNSPEKA